MSADMEIDALASQAEQAADRANRDRLRRLFQRRRDRARYDMIQLYRGLFLTDDGVLRPEASAVLADIAEAAQLGRAEPAIASDAELRERSGRRLLALHIFARLDLDGSRLRDLARKMREAGNE